MKVISINSAEYPCLLKQAGNPPEKIYYKGNWDKRLFDNCLAVVGSRKMTTYGRRITEQLVSEIACQGVTIISGFMYGIDAVAHKAAISAGGRTIAVMPCGINRIHPEYQKELHEEIITSRGLIISEWPGDSQPSSWTYPKRNRIVAGLSQATLIVEAGLKSGSLITADLAKRFKRRLFAVPGPLTSSVSQGTLRLIKEGADMVMAAEDILKVYGLKNSQCPAKSVLYRGLNKLQKSIIEKLSREPSEIDALSRLSGVSASKLGVALSLMQLQGLISEEGGKYYVNTSTAPNPAIYGRVRPQLSINPE